ncbi:hypothetical protein, partial [Treponema endosymbiont of Eucomonympha sp.]
DSSIRYWLDGFALDVISERRDKLIKANKVMYDDGWTSVIDKFGSEIVKNARSRDYYHAVFDNNGKLIDSDRHKAIRREYAGRLFNRYFSAIMTDFGSMLGIIGGVLGIIAFIKS